MKTPKEKLIDHIQGMAPEKAENLLSRLDLLEKVANMNEAQAIYSAHLIGKLFFCE